jgi:toxin CptA
MRLPPQLRVTLGPSRIARVFVVALAVVTMAAVAMLPWPPAAIIAVDAAIAAWAWYRWHWFGPRPPAWRATQVVVSGDRLVAVRNAAGEIRAGFICGATYVSPSLTAIVWRPDGAWRSHSVLILPDMLPADDFRRLRVLLRYGRSDDVAGAPASHA